VVAVARGGREREVVGHGRTALPGGGHAWEATAGQRRPSSGEDDGEVRAGEEATVSAARMTEMTVHRSRSSSERRRRWSRSSSDWRRRSRSPSKARAAAAACGRAAAAGRGVYAMGAVGADVGQSESGRVGCGRMQDRVPPIYDGVLCAVVDYYYLRRPRKALVNNS
jgi:hypothetical protein